MKSYFSIKQINLSFEKTLIRGVLFPKIVYYCFLLNADGNFGKRNNLQYHIYQICSQKKKTSKSEDENLKIKERIKIKGRIKLKKN